MIINTGMRTDIPAFYSKWFLNRLKDGYVLVHHHHPLRKPEELERPADVHLRLHSGGAQKS